MDTLHDVIEHLVGYLVGNDVDTLHEEKIHLVDFNFIRVYDMIHRQTNHFYEDNQMIHHRRMMTISSCEQLELCKHIIMKKKKI